MKIRNESGIALVAVLLILVLLGALFEAFILSVNSEQNLISTDRQQNRSFYGAMAGLEKLTSDLGTLFSTDYNPTTAQINALATASPNVPNVAFLRPGGGSGYQIIRGIDEQRTIPSGNLAGLIGLVRPYTMTVTARAIGTGGAEVQLQRDLLTLAVPVFQYGFFSQSDLSFFAGADFSFGGRVHTNGNLYLSGNWGATLTLNDRVTAVGEVVRNYLDNGYNVSSHTGIVRVARATGVYRDLAKNEGSVTGNAASAQNEPTWTNLSTGVYNSYIRNGRTGATVMNLPLVSNGATPIDIIRRPPANENANNPNVYAQRFYSMASLRILLSDNATDIASLPTVTGTAPVSLAGVLTAGGNSYALAASSGSDADFKVPAGTPLIGGFIKIEMQDTGRNWIDVTDEILGLGINGVDIGSTPSCGYSKPSVANAIIRVQRFKDGPASCGAATATEFWPNTLFDTREAIMREKSPSSFPANVYLGGVMHFIELDVNNLGRWFRGAIGTSGGDALRETGGYVVYFSDRRTNRNASGQETGEYGFEDVVNPADAANGTPNGILDQGEDFNDNNILDTYGATAQFSGYTFTGAPYTGTPTPMSLAAPGVARKNRPIFFRRALKLIRGETINLGTDGTTPYGLTIASENPVYIQGNYNANASTFSGNFDGNHIAAAVIADAVTLLSNNWNDRNSFSCPYSSSSCRNATDTYYRAAIIAGKNKSFAYNSGFPYYDFGTDGGAHNFLRMLENWQGRTLYYRGSIVSLFFSRQAASTFKCGNGNTYNPPTRGMQFDVEFLNFRTLPPKTPMFRDINITGFTRNIFPSE